MGFGLVVRFVTHDAEAADAFDRLTEAVVEEIRRSEPGTLRYVAHTVPGEPHVRVFYELYEDRAAFEAHERTPHVRQFLADRAQHLASFEVTFLEELGGKGAEGR